MKLKKNTGHSISSLFSLLLFSVFALFLMLMLLFSARVYQQTVKQTDSDSGLGTAITYLTTKFRQHDQADRIFSGSLFWGLSVGFCLYLVFFSICWISLCCFVGCGFCGLRFGRYFHFSAFGFSGRKPG